MRSPDETSLRRLGRGAVTIFLALGVTACGALGGGASSDVSIASVANLPTANGPSADYPVVIGDSYTVAGVEYVPTDSLNYDQVGYAAVDAGATGVTAASHVLPLPSYVEVTSLESGRTILVRVERRGPMTSNELIALSPAALAQLGAGEGVAVRVRRTVPPEDQRVLLRAGEAAPLRMDTPGSLLAILQRRLPADGAAPLRPIVAAPVTAQASAASAIEEVEVAASSASPELAPAMQEDSPVTETADAAPALPPIEPVTAASTQAAAPQATSPRPSAEGAFVVQAAAFANPDNARRSADALGGTVSQSGRFYRVRTGPFATRGEAEASLANVRRAGYSDARILTGG